ncbi:hypothetical protein J3B02_006560, partial [Coemansia erecta]
LGDQESFASGGSGYLKHLEKSGKTFGLKSNNENDFKDFVLTGIVGGNVDKRME